MPKEALVSAWTTSDHKLWVTRLRRTSSLSELLQVIYLSRSLLLALTDLQQGFAHVNNTHNLQLASGVHVAGAIT